MVLPYETEKCSTTQDDTQQKKVKSMFCYFKKFVIVSRSEILQADMMITKQQNYNPENIQGMTIISYT